MLIGLYFFRLSSWYFSKDRVCCSLISAKFIFAVYTESITVFSVHSLPDNFLSFAFVVASSSNCGGQSSSGAGSSTRSRRNLFAQSENLSGNDKEGEMTYTKIQRIRGSILFKTYYLFSYFEGSGWVEWLLYIPLSDHMFP